MKKILMLIMIVALAGTFAACSNTSTPKDTAKEFYAASNDKNYEEAEKYIAQEVIDYSNSQGYSLKEGIDVFTNDGDMKKVKIISEEVDGETANVVVKVTFNSGSTQTKELPMFLEEDTWKIGLEQ